MSYFVVVTFDIANGDEEDYETVYEGFAKIGLSTEIASDSKTKIKLPTTTTAGEFNGDSAAAVRDFVCTQTKAVFTANKLKGEIFVSVGGNWAWGHRTP